MDRLRAGIIYVSHRMREIVRLADRVVVLSDGRLVADAPMADIGQGEIVRLMAGRPLQDIFARSRAVRPEPVLEVRDLHTKLHGGVDLTVRAGEVVALAGPIGAGRSELAQAIFGDLPRTGGSIREAGNIVLGAVAIAVHVVLRFSVWGRNVYALSGKPIAARLSGANLNRYRLTVYMLSGVGPAIGGIVLTARTHSGRPQSGSAGLELEAVTAALPGGCALDGGKGTVFGTMLAVAPLGVLTNGMIPLGIQSFCQLVAKGALLVAAVTIQQYRLSRTGVQTGTAFT